MGRGKRAKEREAWRQPGRSGAGFLNELVLVLEDPKHSGIETRFHA
jgi:hypothetical protein